jgi:hypothetical protein
MSNEMEQCLICFNYYLSKYGKDHECEFTCDLCGEVCDEGAGTLSFIGIEATFTHSPNECSEQAEAEGE